MHEVKVTTLNGTPVFVIGGFEVILSKVYGATLLRAGAWVYPAFYPVYTIVLQDLRALKIPFQLSPSAQTAVTQLDAFAQRIKNQELPAGFTFKTQPYAHQLEGLVHALYFHRCALFYSCGLGKGLPLEAPVLTPRGWRSVGSLHVGDRVFGGDGKPHRVTGVYPQGDQHLNRVCFTDRTAVTCDDAHLWVVKSHGRPAQVLATRDLAEGSLTYGKPYGPNKNWQRYTYSIPMTAPVQFSKRAVPLDAYVLGVLLGDGYLGRGQVPSFSSKDDWIGRKVKARLPSNVRIHRSVYAGNPCPVWHICGKGTLHGPRTTRWNSNPLVPILQKLGVWGARAADKHVPDLYLFNALEHRLALLQGLMDTDGYSGEVPEFVSVSKKLSEAVVFIVESLGGTARMRSKETSYTYRGERRSGQTAWRVTFTLPPGYNPFLLPRKATRYRAPTRGLNRRICTIEDAGVGSTVCISVDSPDECFLTSDCVVTHNTKIVIDWQRALGCRPLILCPKVVMPVWAKELQVHGIDQEYRIVDALTKKNKLKQLREAKDYAGTVISYDTTRNWIDDIIQEVPYNAIVADESHYIKGHQSARTEMTLALSQRAGRRIIMSGTPSLGDPRDMYSQLRFLAPAFASESFWTYQKTFCAFAPHNKHILLGYKNLDVLNDRVNLIALRRIKEECLDLPKRLVHDVPVTLAKKQRQFYNTLILSEEYHDLYEQITTLLTEAGTVDVPNAAVLLNKLIQISCGFVYKTEDADLCDTCEHLRDCVMEDIKPYTRACHVDKKPRPPAVERFTPNGKLEVLLEQLEAILSEPTNKCIIWAQYLPELALIEDALKAAKIGYVRVDGSVTGKVQTLADRFNAEPTCRVYLGQVSTGVGITLNAANYMIYYSLPWKLGDYEQSKDRNYRVGQERDTVIYRLLGRGTVDENIARALTLKQTVAQTITCALACARCAKHEECAGQGVTLFDDACIHERRVTRAITKARIIS